MSDREGVPGLVVRCVRRITLRDNEKVEVRKRDDGRIEVYIFQTHVDRQAARE